MQVPWSYVTVDTPESAAVILTSAAPTKQPRQPPCLPHNGLRSVPALSMQCRSLHSVQAACDKQPQDKRTAEWVRWREGLTAQKGPKIPPPAWC